jgi:ATP-dependent helicase/nuclease subunit B
VLPGLDLSLDAEGWAGVGGDPSHPQFGLKQLLDRLGMSREVVRNWADAPVRSNPRQENLSQALRPAPTTDAWRASAANPPASIAEGFDGLALVEAADPGEEAAAIALMLRRVLETPDKTAALVTPDRALARRVAVELARYRITIDDSAGKPLAQTPAGTFLCLVAEAAAASFSPVPLFALLKHPLASGGEKRTEFLRSVRSLDLALRGPRSNPGLDGIASALSRDAALARWFGALAATFRPIEALMSRERGLLPALLDAHLQAAESLSTDENKHPCIWDKESGEAAARLCDSIRLACENLPELEPSAYAPLFRRLADETPVRTAFGQHPRLAILGPLEARLLSFDLIVLGGLNEGTWPRAAQIDPWLSRPMRAALGLESPERAIGRSAHDFESLAANPHVVLTRAGKVDGTQTIASRWLLRLQQFAKGLEHSHLLADETRWTDIVRNLNATAPAERSGRPAVRPPVALRPRRLTVTEIETWRRDPYAIYARRILRLEPLDPLDAEVGPLERGRVIHKALEEFIRENPNELSRDATQKLIAIAEALFREENIPDSVLTIWRPRFAHAAEWFVQQERENRALVTRSVVEASGEMEIGAPAGAFVLRGRADRIDLLKEGGASIIDYKSGALPSPSDLVGLRTPQLPLEGAMLAAGAFVGLEQLTARELVYVRFSGGGRPGEWRKIDVDAAGISARALAWLTERVARFDDERTSYLSRVDPYGGGFTGDYDHLARAREWATT